MSSPQPLDSYFAALRSQLAAASTKAQLYKAIVNAPFHDPLTALDFDLGVIVLLLVNKQAGTIDRIALSNTYSAKGAVRMSVKPFKEIKIPVDHETNAIAQAIQTGKPQSTTDWKYLFIPALTAQDARFNQAGAGIETSVVHPLDVTEGGALIFSCYQPLASMTKKHTDFIKNYTALASEYLTKLTGK